LRDRKRGRKSDGFAISFIALTPGLTDMKKICIMFPQMDNTRIQKRIDVIRYYHANDTSIRKTAKLFDVNYRTVHKWLKWHEHSGEKRLLENYHRPWNRFRIDVEEEAMRLKEQYPAITVRAMQNELTARGLKMSIKGIWGILHRFGCAGLDKKSMGNYFTQAKGHTREASARLEQATELLKAGRTDEAAAVLNPVPFLPSNEIITQIPDNLLNLRRKVEKAAALFGIVPLHQYLNDLRNLQTELKKAGMNYSALQIGIIELLALEWIYRPVEQLKKARELKKMLAATESGASYLLFELRFLLLVSEGIAHAELSHMPEARAIARLCRRMLAHRRYVSRQPMLDLSALYTYIDEFKKAEKIHEVILNKTVDPDNRKEVMTGYANILFTSGNYKKLSRIIRSKDFQEDWSIHARIFIFRAMLSLTRGEPQKAVEQCMEALKLCRHEELNKQIFNAYVIMACAHSSMGKASQACAIFHRLVLFLKKKNLKRYIPEIKLLLKLRTEKEYAGTPARDIHPVIRLILLLARGSYSRAYALARQKGILSSFFRFIFFFPETVVQRLHKGKPTYLPRAILMLPAFNHKNPAYHVKFIGKFLIYKDQRLLKTRLQPKETAFIIHLASRAGTPGTSIQIDGIYKNFWPKARQPARNFSHTLVRIKKALGIPTHLLIVARRDNPVLVNRGVFFTNDFQDFEQAIAQAQAFKRADAWDFAKKEYLRAFKLWREEPFRKVYDRWSEDFRTTALNRLTNEIDDFVKECKSRQDNIFTERTIRFVSRIINSETGSVG
jgi:transposase